MEVEKNQVDEGMVGKENGRLKMVGDLQRAVRGKLAGDSREWDNRGAPSSSKSKRGECTE